MGDDTAREMIEKAKMHLAYVCEHNAFKLRAQIPARPGVDDDLVIMDALESADAELREYRESRPKWIVAAWKLGAQVTELRTRVAAVEGVSEERAEALRLMAAELDNVETRLAQAEGDTGHWRTWLSHGEDGRPVKVVALMQAKVRVVVVEGERDAAIALAGVVSIELGDVAGFVHGFDGWTDHVAVGEALRRTIGLTFPEIEERGRQALSAARTEAPSDEEECNNPDCRQCNLTTEAPNDGEEGKCLR